MTDPLDVIIGRSVLSTMPAPILDVLQHLGIDDDIVDDTVLEHAAQSTGTDQEWCIAAVERVLHRAQLDLTDQIAAACGPPGHRMGVLLDTMLTGISTIRQLHAALTAAHMVVT